MKIGRRVGGASEPAAAPDVINARRIEAARRNQRWREVTNELVERGRFYVHAETDEVFVPYQGAVWNGAKIEFAELSPLYFAVEDGALLLLERCPFTWSELIAAQAGAR